MNSILARLASVLLLALLTLAGHLVERQPDQAARVGEIEDLDLGISGRKALLEPAHGAGHVVGLERQPGDLAGGLAQRLEQPLNAPGDSRPPDAEHHPRVSLTGQDEGRERLVAEGGDESDGGQGSGVGTQGLGAWPRSRARSVSVSWGRA